MKKKEQIKHLQTKVEEQEAQLAQSDFVITELKNKLNLSETAYYEGQLSVLSENPHFTGEPANYREELNKLKEENESLKAKLKNQETLEAIANTRPFDVNILETELRNITKKYSILEEAFIKIRNIATSL